MKRDRRVGRTVLITQLEKKSPACSGLSTSRVVLTSTIVPAATPDNEMRICLRWVYTGASSATGTSNSCSWIGFSLTTVPSGRTTFAQLMRNDSRSASQPKVYSL